MRSLEAARKKIEGIACLFCLVAFDCHVQSSTRAVDGFTFRVSGPRDLRVEDTNALWAPSDEINKGPRALQER